MFVGTVTRVTTDLPVTRARQDNGVEIDWVRLAVLAVEPLARSVPRAVVNEKLGLQPSAVMRGFGGFRRITEVQFRSITEAGRE